LADEVFFLLACLECGDPDRPLVMPFGSAAERGKWASGHTQGTGHDRWWVKDQAGTPDPLDAWHIAFASRKWRPVLAFNAEAVAVKTMAEHMFTEFRRVIAERDAEIARLHAELDGMRQVPVEYASTAALEFAMATVPAREDGTILRETGGEKRAFEWKAAAGEWVRVS
jgi:hypothetical protein